MHVNAVGGDPEGPVPTMCGEWLADGEGAPYNAPPCVPCHVAAGLMDDDAEDDGDWDEVW